MSPRRNAVPDPAVERELAALDAALRGEPVDPEFRDLEDLVRDVRAVRPLPPERFADELDRRVTDGFRRPRRARVRALRRAMRSRMLVPALGGAASLVVAVVLAVSFMQGTRDDVSQLQTAPTTPVMPEEEGRGGTRESEPSVARAPVPPGRDKELPGRRDRRVERQATLTLAAPTERIEEVADEVVAVTDRVGGIVVSSNVNIGEDGSGQARFDLRVPSARLREALAQLSRLAHVRARSQSTADVTAMHVSAEERLREALAERQSLLRQLARADTENEAESVRARLRLVNDTIAARRAEIARLRERTSFSAIALTVEAEESGDGSGGPWTPGDALRDALRILEVAAGVLVVALAFVTPFALVGLVAGWAVRRLRLRRREAALDRA